MDKNIDPTIADLELFQVALDREEKDTLDLVHHIHDESTVQDDSASIRNVFRLNEYVADQSQDGHNGSTAAAALNMMQYNGFDNPTTNDHVSETGNHLSGEPDYTDFSNSALIDEEFLLDEKPISAVKLVEYKPNEKTKRLGRPRKHILKTLSSPADSSSQNFNEAILSKFRLDALPLEGPGSRGGRQGGRKNPRGRISSSSIRKRKLQSLLNFNVNKNGSNLELKLKSELQNSESANDPNIIEENSNSDLNEENGDSEIMEEEGLSNKDDISTEVVEIVSDSEEPFSEDAEETALKKKASFPVRSSKSPKNTPKPALKWKQGNRNSKVTSCTRTTVLNNRHKVTRQLPGPIIPLYYDLYDDNVIEATQNAEATSEKLALGFPISEAPYAKDIMFIISYLCKFQEIVDLELIGPQDIEFGLGLNNTISSTSSSKFVSKVKVPEPVSNDDIEVSNTMNELFLKLLGLILNRKRDIASQENAISELKTRAYYLGLPREWKHIKEGSNKVYLAVMESNINLSNETFNPFYYSPFELKGLNGLDPPDRLIMIRVLMQWSFQTSDRVREYISTSIQNQDLLGEKDTYYVPRSVARGFKNCEDAKREAENKIKNRKSEITELKYVDPVSDPFKHSMRLRLDEMFAGDCGFNVGRFYLCRMSSGKSGGLSTVKKMRSMPLETFSLPFSSPFKVYVQDVHQMLHDSLSNYGVEFDNETEIKRERVTNNYYYEVASNVEELQEFVEYLSMRLGITVNADQKDPIRSTSMIYKPVLNLYNYLSWVLEIATKQFSIQSNDTGSRSLRRKNVDYNQSKVNKELGRLIDDNHMGEDNIDYEKFDDDDYYDDDGEEEEEEDDDNNDDYIE